jgi:hypothetical protein
MNIFIVLQPNELKFSFTGEQFIYERETSKFFLTTSLVSYDEDFFHIEKRV